MKLQAGLCESDQSTVPEPTSLNPAAVATSSVTAAMPVVQQNEMQDTAENDLEESGWSSGFEESDDDMIGGPF